MSQERSVALSVAFVVMSLAAFTGCSQLEWREYRGPQDWATGGAFVSDLDGMPLYEGLPDRPYAVVGMIEAYDDGDWFRSAANVDKIKDLAQTHDGDALLWISGRAVTLGEFRQGVRSSGGEGLSAGGDRPADSLELIPGDRTGFRDCLLMIRWK